MRDRLILFGAGGHAKVVAEAWLLGHASGEIIFLDDGPSATGRTILGHDVKGGRDWLNDHWAGIEVALGVGSNAARDALIDGLAGMGRTLATVVHPAAIISPSAHLESGCFLAAGSVINAEARLGQGVILNTGASIDHDCRIGRSAHIAPGARLCGNVTVGERSLIGTASAIIPGINIGSDVTVGAGSVVVRPIPSGETWAGCPARPLDQRRSTIGLIVDDK